MVELKSERAKKTFESPRFMKSEKEASMKKYPGDLGLWLGLEWENTNVKNLSFTGDLEPFQIVLLESMARLLINKPISKLDDLSLRECEAFLRDRNSEPALVGMGDTDERELKKVFQWVRSWQLQSGPVPYRFPSEKGAFRSLKLVDKVRELKSFLNSPEIASLYENVPRPTLVDVEELTVYIHAPYDSQREKSLFQELHSLGVETFREEELNFIPEAT